MRRPTRSSPVNALAGWVTVAGCDLACARCGAEGTAPLPHEVGYGAAVERFLAEHRDCLAEHEEARA